MHDRATTDDQRVRALDAVGSESAGRTSCPHCGDGRTCGHGSFKRSDGTRQPRRLCRACGRTFNDNTGTPIHYIKKRSEWKQLPEVMAQSASVRRTAALLHVSNDTSFRWRHRLLSALSSRPQPALAGSVGAGEAYIRYSEKGSRGTGGPGARNDRTSSTAPRFRRLAQGRPSCVLLAGAENAWVSAIPGAGRPTVPQLRDCLRQLLKPGASLHASGLAPYAQACQGLDVVYCDTGNRHAAGVDQLRHSLYRWLVRFRGVATRYLSHYLAWHRVVGRTGRCQATA